MSRFSVGNRVFPLQLDGTLGRPIPGTVVRVDGREVQGGSALNYVRWDDWTSDPPAWFLDDELTSVKDHRLTSAQKLFADLVMAISIAGIGSGPNREALVEAATVLARLESNGIGGLWADILRRSDS